ncbi:uncharacterized protein FYW49_011245 [Xenentodon cancila]
MVQETIQIFARIKPTKRSVAVYSVDNGGQTGSSLEFVVARDMAAGVVNNKRESYKFRFQKVFNQDTKQEEIFENIAKPVAESALAGYNGTIFAYGQTGSGKTFTITGGAERYSDRGIIPRTLSYLYKRFSQDTMVYTTHISYLEIYNETGYDLLDSRHEASRLEDLPRVMIMEDGDQNIHLRNLSLQQSANEEEALNLLFLGDTNRMIAETPTNQASTRSHCIFTVHLCRREPGSATLRRSKLHLVDLAGSDRVSKTGLNGVLLTEAKYINLSLHHLEQVIIALSEKNRSHIPYRNSMLTSVLRDSLGGNCMTTMIANIAVEKRNLDESISTCRFAQRVALIKNEAVLNEELDPALLIARLKREIQSLREELAVVTGVQRDEHLTAEETCKLEELVKTYLNDPDPDVTLSLGSDMRKIQHCFSLLKKMILDKRYDKIWRTDQGRSPPVTVTEENLPVSRISDAEVAKLKEMLRQRDNEISILVKILKKEKKRADDAAAQTPTIINSHSLSSQRVSIKSEVSQLREENVANVLSTHGGEVSTLVHFRHGSVETFSLNHEGQVFTMAELREGNMECHQADHEGKMSTMGQMRDGNMKNQPADHGGRTSTIPQRREGNMETHPNKYGGQVFTTAQLQEGNMYPLPADHSGSVSRTPQTMREGNMETHSQNHGGRISTIPQTMREGNVETHPQNHGGRISTIPQTMREGNVETHPQNHGGRISTIPQTMREGNVETHSENHGGRISTIPQTMREGNVETHSENHGGRTSTIPQRREGNMETHPNKYGGQVFTTAQLQEGNMYPLPADHSGRVSRTPQTMREGNMETHSENHGGRISTIPQTMREGNVETHPQNHGGRISTIPQTMREGNVETHPQNHGGRISTIPQTMREGNVETHSENHGGRISTIPQTMREGNVETHSENHGGRISTIPQTMREGNVETHPQNHGGQISTIPQTMREGNVDGNVETHSENHGGRISTIPQTMREGNVETHPQNHGGQISTIPQTMREGNVDGNVETHPENHGGRAIQYMKRGPQLSMGKQEAFEIFIRDHEEHQTIEDNKKILKQRSAEAKGLGEQLNTARNRINELKTQLDTRRRQRAAQGVLGNQTQAEKESDIVEENLRKQIKDEKAFFKSTIDRLKALKTEMEHLQLLLERVKFKIQKDFQKWWNQETSNLQASESGATARLHTPSPSGALQTSSSPGLGAAGLISVVNECPAGRHMKPHCSISVASLPAVPAWINTSTNGQMTNSNSSAEQSVFVSSTFPYSSVPLTGDHQVDADIQAFVRARQNLLSRTGYGNLSPSTVSGQVFCVFYALCGIPLNLAFLKQLGKCLTVHLGRLERGMVAAVPHRRAFVALAVSLFFTSGSLLLLVIPPLLFSYVEGWTFGEGFYFAFITLSTIGFGDYVVGTDPDKEYISLYRSLTGIWIIFGLAWLALILNIGARIMENVVVLTHPGFKKQKEEEEEASSSKLEDTSKI